MAVKVAINGFGRIGRLAFRQMFEADGYEVVAINDLTSPAMLAHLLKYDTAQGSFLGKIGENKHTVEAGEDYIVVDGKKITIYAIKDAKDCPWGELGITVNINKVEWASFTPMRRAGDYDVSRNGWVMDYNDPSNMIELFTTTNGNNDGKYSNPEFDAAVEASKVADKSVHFQKLHEAEDILMADAACIPVAYYNDFWLQSPSLKGTWHSPYGYWYLQYGYVEQ